MVLKLNFAVLKKSLHVKIGSNIVDNVDHFKYLGVWLDQSLSWSVHIEKSTKTVNKRVGVLRKIRSVLPQHTLNLLYKTLKRLTSTLPPQLCNVFNYAATAHSYSTRSGSQGNFVSQLLKTNSGKRKFSARGVNSFNQLLLTLKNPLPYTVANFKVQYKSLIC